MVFAEVFVVCLIDLSTFTFAASAFLFSNLFFQTPARVGANTNETIDISLIRIFMDGPEVSLNGSPTVSPVTEALCGSEPL